MLKKFITLLVLCTGLKAFSTSADQPLRIVADEWPPFSGESLPGQGISVDVISTVLTRAGYQVRAQILPWARIMDGARKDEYDIVGSLFSDPDIATFMTYGNPFYQTEIRFLRQAGSTIEVNAYQDLASHSIAVGDGFLYSPQFDADAALNKQVVSTAIQGIQMVAHGRADLTLDSNDVLRYSTKTQDPGLADRVEMLPFVLARQGIHMAMRQTHPQAGQIIADFNRTLGEMQADGSLAALLAKHQ